MLKPFTLSVSLAVALGASTVSLAGGHGGAMPTPQAFASEQVMPSPQGTSYAGCGETCAPAKKKHCLSNLFKHKPKCYTYTWVLKKKRVHGHKSSSCGGCGEVSCGSCASEAVYPSAQGGYPSPQGEVYPTGQVYGAGQAMNTGSVYGAGQAISAPATYGAGQMGGATYGAGQLGGATGGSMAPAPGAGGEDVPPPPAVNRGEGAGATPNTPAPAPPAAGGDDNAANGPQSSLLFLAPAGN